MFALKRIALHLPISPTTLSQMYSNSSVSSNGSEGRESTPILIRLHLIELSALG